MVDWRFLPQIFGQVVGTYEGLLLLCECRCGRDCTFRWWGHLNTTCHNGTCLSFLHWEVVGNKKVVKTALAPCSKITLEHKKSIPRITSCKLKPSRPRAQRATWWNFHCLIFNTGVYLHCKISAANTGLIDVYFVFWNHRGYLHNNNNNNNNNNNELVCRTEYQEQNLSSAIFNIQCTINVTSLFIRYKLPSVYIFINLSYLDYKHLPISTMH